MSGRGNTPCPITVMGKCKHPCKKTCARWLGRVFLHGAMAKQECFRLIRGATPNSGHAAASQSGSIEVCRVRRSVRYLTRLIWVTLATFATPKHLHR